MDAGIQLGEWQLKFTREDGEIIDMRIALDAGLTLNITEENSVDLTVDLVRQSFIRGRYPRTSRCPRQRRPLCLRPLAGAQLAWNGLKLHPCLGHSTHSAREHFSRPRGASHQLQIPQHRGPLRRMDGCDGRNCG